MSKSKKPKCEGWSVSPAEYPVEATHRGSSTGKPRRVSVKLIYGEEVVASGHRRIFWLNSIDLRDRYNARQYAPKLNLERVLADYSDLKTRTRVAGQRAGRGRLHPMHE